MDKSIIPECYADTLLIETLVPTERGYNHKHSCFKVESAMKSLDKFAVGILDNDKKQIKYLQYFRVVDEVVGSLILWKHTEKHHFIIQICPALEKWILNICDAESIDIKNFGLQNDLDKLKQYTKSIASIEDQKLKALFKEIGYRKENVSVKRLRSWIKILKEKNYQTDINELRNA